MDNGRMYRNQISLHFQAFITNRLTPQLLKGLAGLSEDLLDSYGDSWGFADEECVYHFIIKFS